MLQLLYMAGWATCVINNVAGSGHQGKDKAERHIRGSLQWIYIILELKLVRSIKSFFVFLPDFNRESNQMTFWARWMDAQLIPYSYTPFRMRMRGIPELQKTDLVHYRLARSVGFDRVFVCNGRFVVAGDIGESSIRPPGQTVTQLFSSREHTEQPQLVSPVIFIPCHMIWAVCNNTQGASAGPVRKWDDPWLTA